MENFNSPTVPGHPNDGLLGAVGLEEGGLLRDELVHLGRIGPQLQELAGHFFPLVAGIRTRVFAVVVRDVKTVLGPIL